MNHLRVKTYAVLERAIEEGIDIGWRRSHKHTDSPDEDTIKDTMLREIITALDEVFDFNSADDVD